jgi:hypothetical protein
MRLPMVRRNPTCIVFETSDGGCPGARESGEGEYERPAAMRAAALTCGLLCANSLRASMEDRARVEQNDPHRVAGDTGWAETQSCVQRSAQVARRAQERSDRSR